MTPVLLQLQQESLDRSDSVTDLLRKSLVISRKRIFSEFESWINSELNGYGPHEKVPEYRKAKGSVKFWNPYRGWSPIIFQDPSEGEMYSFRNIGQSIAELESIAHEKEATSEYIPFPQDIERQLCKSLDAGFETKISLACPNTEIIKIIEQVRNVILNCTLKLEEEGIVGEGMTFTAQEAQSAQGTSQAVNNFYGPVHNPQIQQSNTAAIQVHSRHQIDREAISTFVELLASKIQDLQLTADQESELRAELETISSQLTSPKPKTTILRECGRSIRSILEKAGGTVVASLFSDQLSKLPF
ncbi:hypothetical protein [Cyanobium gracile]|uniref:AbiTii domain-containing protein n=1 Tax=Cyanobium gracile (strain ATCC 27147 / PCC 6307) TaxID=292564 RepID=K9PBW0_CYAGP|nr:hypothetical protein [Cyanobium gracile]AFY30428.1 hypothetical protein Cyagr_3360 [Cyanobium gracile PCC 6307]